MKPATASPGAGARTGPEGGVTAAGPPDGPLPVGAAAGRRGRDWGPAATSALLAALVFAVTLGGTYVYDDLTVVYDDPRLADPGRWQELWAGPYIRGAVDNLYRPLTSTTFALQVWLHGHLPWAFHAVNLLLHAAATASVAEFARRLWNVRPAYAVGFLFAAHPVHTEAVAWLIGRSELLCTLATFGGFCLFLRRPLTGRRGAGIFFCFAVAVLSKEQGILFPPMLLLLGLATRATAPLTPPERARAKGLGLALLWALAAYLVYRESILPMAWDRSRLNPDLQPLILSKGLDRWLMPLVLFGRTVATLLWPARLSVDYGGEVIGPAVRYGEPYVYLGAAGALAWLAAFALSGQRRRADWAFCLLGFALSYGLVSNFLALIGTIFAERLLYMPSAFLIALAGMLLARLPRAAGVGVLALLVTLGAARSFAYARQWNDRLTFYQSSLAAQPRSVVLHELLFDELRLRGNLPAAREVARLCTARFPGLWTGYLLEAEAAAETGDLSDAERLITAAYDRGAGLRIARAQALVDAARGRGAAPSRPAPAP